MPNEAYVRFVGVQKTYDGETLVVRDFDLDVARGEFLTLLGPSGSGKTTCLMMLAGFESVTQGEIVLDGRPINNAPPHKRDIGVVFQNYALFPHMTVDENVAFPLEVRKVPQAEIEARTRRALDMVQLSGFGHRRPAQLSGGQQQRVAVARALVFEPKLVLMDEPLGALDKQMREQMQYEVKHLHERLGVTVVYVTHDQTEALTMSNRIAVMQQGAIQQIATPQDLYDRPENAFVAQFIGENNRLLGMVREIRGRTCVVAVGGRRGRGARRQRRGRRQPLDPVAAPGARADRSEPGLLRQHLRRARRGADLSRRPHARARARLRLRRFHHQAAQRGGARAAGGGRAHQDRLADRGLPRARRD